MRLWHRALLYMILVGGSWFIAFPAGLVLLSANRKVPRARGKPAVLVGGLAFAFGTCLSFWAAHDLVARGHGTPFPYDPTKELVTDGLYGWMRNPQAVAMMLLAGGESLALKVPYTPAYLALTLVYLELLAKPFEDRQLSRSFGSAYDEYRSSVPRWWLRRPDRGT